MQTILEIIFLVFLIYLFSPNSDSTDKVENNQKTVQTTKQATTSNEQNYSKQKTVKNQQNEVNGVDQAVKNFMKAYLSGNRQSVIDNSLYEGRKFDKNLVYNLFDEQLRMLSIGLSTYESRTGAKVSIRYGMTNSYKINDNEYNVTIILEISPDNMKFSPVLVKKVQGVWLVDSESFAEVSNSVFMGY